jgi:hypothetical protein
MSQNSHLELELVKNAGTGKAKCHNKWVAGVGCQVRMMTLSTTTDTVKLVKATVQLALHSCPMETRDEVSRAGTIWMCGAAAAGSACSLLSLTSWVDTSIKKLLGLQMVMG